MQAPNFNPNAFNLKTTYQEIDELVQKIEEPNDINRPKIKNLAVLNNLIKEISHYSEEDKNKIAALQDHFIKHVPLKLVKFVNSKKYAFLSPAQINALPDECMGGRTGEGFYDKFFLPFEVQKYLKFERIGQIRNKDTLAALPPNLLPYLHPDQVKFLDDNTLNKLLINCRIEEKDKPEMAERKKKLVRAVPVARITPQVKLWPEHYELLFNSENIKAIPPMPANLHIFYNLSTPDQLEALTPAQIGCIPTKDKDLPALRKFLAKLPLQQFQHLQKMQIKQAGPESINKLSVQQIEEHVPSHNIRYLNVPEKVAQLRIKAPYVSPNMVPHLADEMLLLLKDLSQIAQVPDDKLIHLEDQQLYRLPIDRLRKVPALAERLSRQITSPDGVDFNKLTVAEIELQLDPTLVAHIQDAEKVGELSIKAPFVHPDMVQNLNDDALPLLTNPLLIKRIPHDKFHLLTDDQISHLSPNQIWNIETEDLIKRLPDEFLKYINPNMASALEENSKVQFLATEEQIAEFAENHNEEWLKFIQLKQINIVPEKYLKEISDPQFIKELEASKIEYLAPEQYAHLSKDQIEKIDKKELLANLQDTYLIYINVKMVKELQVERLKHLDADQFKHISQNQVNQLRDQTLLHRLPDAWIKFTHPDAVELLKDTQLQYLDSAEQIDKVDPKRYDHLVRSQVSLVPSNRLKFLPKQLSGQMPPDMVWPIDILETLPADKVKQLLKHNVEILPPAQIKHLKVDQLPYLKKAEQIREMSTWNLGKLAWAQFKLCSFWQKLAFLFLKPLRCTRFL